MRILVFDFSLIATLVEFFALGLFGTQEVVPLYLYKPWLIFIDPLVWPRGCIYAAFIFEVQAPGPLWIREQRRRTNFRGS